MYKARCGFLLLLLTITSYYPYAQSPGIRFSHITTTDGLSQSTVKCILKDRYGFMWFGTYDGLNKYDGTKFTVYKHVHKDSNSISSSNILSIFEDHLGNLWIGTNEGGLSLYDRRYDRFINYRANESDPAGLSNKGVTVIYEDRQNNLWVGTYWGLNLFDRQTKKFKRYLADPSIPNSPSNATINALLEDHHGNLWVGTNGGLNLFDRRNQTFKAFTSRAGDSTSLLSNKVNVIAEDQKGRIWIGTDAGLSMMDGVQGRFKNFVHDTRLPNSPEGNNIDALYADAGNRLWIGNDAALDLLDIDHMQFTHFKREANDESSLNNSSVLSLYNDRNGILWIGTFAGGVNKYDRNLSYFGLFRNNNADWTSLSFNVVSSFAEAPNGDMWIGTDGGGLNLFHQSTKQFTRYNPEPQRKNWISTFSVLRLCQGSKYNYLWVGTYGHGVDRFDPLTQTFQHFTKGNDIYHLSDNDIYALFEDHTGNIWVGTNTAGINVIDPKTGSIRKFRFDPNAQDSLSSDIIRDFSEDKQGRIWIATYSGGLCAYDPSNGKFRRYNMKNASLSSDNILSVYVAEDGSVWAGTQGSGLNRMKPNSGQFSLYSEAPGLSDGIINDIIEDKLGYLWMSTNKGISRLNPGTNHFENYGIHNGLQGPEFNPGAGFRSSNGSLYFGGSIGFNIINPEDVTINKYKPVVYFTGFQLFNHNVGIGTDDSLLKQHINLTREITLSYAQSVFTIGFAALNFTVPENNQYAYMLEGFDKNWNYVGTQKEATYTNLDPGTYHFRVKAANNDGLWNEQDLVLTIIITPPYWKTWWFELLAVITVIVALFVLYRIRMRSIDRQRIRLVQQVRERTESLTKMTHEERKARQEAHNANIELERKNKELEQFAYVASHDLQEPLRTTSAFAHLLRQQYQGNMDEKADKYLSFIIDSSERMKVLINDLLDYSRIGRKLELSRVDCNEIIKTVKSDLAISILESGAEIVAEPLPVINGYTTEIKLLFQNLVSNAIKFRKKEESPVIHISAVREGAFWQFSFKDNGIGLDPRHSERIFVIFQRLHTRTEYQGSGIGLSHCKKIVELHKGRIWVESVPGEGSNFLFTLFDGEQEIVQS